jgi:hypothetical protein
MRIMMMIKMKTKKMVRKNQRIYLVEKIIIQKLKAEIIEQVTKNKMMMKTMMMNLRD